MAAYNNKEDLISDIKKTSTLFINEFKEIKDDEKDKIVLDVDRTPAQMIAYQLGWMTLLRTWESNEQKDIEQSLPKEGYKWNKLGSLYEVFYKEYDKYTMNELIEIFTQNLKEIIEMINAYTDEELFETNKRKWASSTPSNWPIYKWISINTVSPFKSFRTKIRKWKKNNK